jgi:hypothetical protein
MTPKVGEVYLLDLGSDILMPWKMSEPECWSIGVMECWKTQYSITPLWCQANS